MIFYSDTSLSHGRSGLTPILFAQSFCKKQHKSVSLYWTRSVLIRPLIYDSHHVVDDVDVIGDPAHLITLLHVGPLRISRSQNREVRVGLTNNSTSSPPLTRFIHKPNVATHRLQPPLDGHQVRHPLVEPGSKVFWVDRHETLTLKTQTSRWRRRKWPSSEPRQSKTRLLIVLICEIRKVRVYFSLCSACSFATWNDFSPTTLLINWWFALLKQTSQFFFLCRLTGQQLHTSCSLNCWYSRDILA